MTRILTMASSYQRLENRLRTIAPDADYVLLDADGLNLNGEEITPEEANCDIGWISLDSIRENLIRDIMVATVKSPDLKWLQSSFAGYDAPIFADLAKRPLRISTSDSQAPAIAEYVIAGAFHWLQRFDYRIERHKAKKWDRQMFREMSQTHWVIVGMGNIGEQIAQRAKALGARITAVRSSDRSHDLADRTVAFTDILSVAPDADVICFACALTPDTQHIGNEALFQSLKDDAIFINIGRGGLVDEAALLAGLDAGKPGFAVLDVFETEPLPEDSAFWGHPQVLVTPHDSNAGLGTAARGDQLFLDNLKRYLDGDRLINEQKNETILASHGL